VEIIPTQLNTPWECAATDGDVVFDKPSGTWHYLFQCLSRAGGWNGCTMERTAPDPMGPFTATANNPVIPGGSLWSKICVDPSADCVTIPGGPGRVHDEGTFNIFQHDANGYYIAFHGFDGRNGYRGIARTPDFVNYIAGDPSQGTPADAIYDRLDAIAWRETWNAPGPVGGGAGSILYENGQYYSIVETGDINLACIDGQNWDWGMSRSPSLTATAWDQLPAGNPFLYSSKLQERSNLNLACNPAYARMFHDTDGSVYLHVTRESLDPNYSGIFLYRLVRSASLLDNGDLWKCNSDGWNVFPSGPTNMAVYRLPNNSSDEGCYLATNCGQGTCQAGQSLYQDVPVANVGGQTLSYGGKFATDSGAGGLDLAVLELDPSYNIVASHTTHVDATTAWAGSSGAGTLHAATTKLRYQIYLKDAVTFRADEMYLEIVP
jgi:hypothetical protein